MKRKHEWRQTLLHACIHNGSMTGPVNLSFCHPVILSPHTQSVDGDGDGDGGEMKMEMEMR